MAPLRMHTEKELHVQMPSLQPSVQHSNSGQSHTKPATKDDIPSDGMTKSPIASTGHQRIVLTDTVAARYLEDDPKTTVLARRQQIEGYEIYLVEQWACSRSHPTFLINTYTGNPSDVVLASILSVPADEADWSPQMRLYFSSLTDYHARRKETPHGTLMITNLSGFPSSLTVIPIPGGDLRKYREIFIVNENLKRLGCSGRLGIKLAPPSSATEAKFHQLYRTSEKISLNGSVIELVKLCQVALVLFGKLEPEYADGLLCDVTEKAINDWWIDIGAEYYTVEPHDGILGPTTVAALLGMLMGARNRLSACNAPVAKDVFDVESTKRGIAHFQKAQHIPRTRRLDRQTLDRLRRATAKAASKEGWAVPRAFKSTVAELGGKGGEMVMGMVGAGQKDGIAEIETVDLDQFIELARGEHAKWLWHGKPRKSTATDMFSRLPGEDRSTSPDDLESTSKLLTREATLDQQKLIKRESTVDSMKKTEIWSPDAIEKDKDKDKDPSSKRAAIKARLDPGSGFRHIKDAVGLRSHSSKLSKEEHNRQTLNRNRTDSAPPLHALADGDQQGQNILDYDHSSLISHNRTLTEDEPAFTKVLTETPRDSASTLALDRANIRTDAITEPPGVFSSLAGSDGCDHLPTVASSVAGSIYHGIGLSDKLFIDETHEIPLLLRRTMSENYADLKYAPRNDDWWPRHLSFSVAEEHVLKWKSITVEYPDEEAVDDDDNCTDDLAMMLAAHTLKSEQLKRLYYRLTTMSNTDAAWVASRLQDLNGLETAIDADIETLESIYYPRLDTYHALREDVHGVVTNNRTQLNVSLRELGNIGDKLEYEVSALRSKIEDVEDALVEFERQVDFVESRADELEKVLGNKEGWLHWALRMTTGIGNRPN